MGTQATLADVATLAGVSLATASRALSPTKGSAVGPELRARVRAAAAELSYAPNAHAQAMRSPTASSAGLIVHDIADPVAAAIASGVLAAAADQNLIVTIGASGGDAEAEVRLVETLRRQRARGIILAGSRFADSSAQRWLADEVSAIRAGGGRVVTIGQHTPGTHAVVVDDRAGADGLARALWARGYRRFAVLAGPEFLITSEDRVGGFRDAVTALGGELPEEQVLASQMSRDGGYTSLRDLLDHGVEVDCVFAVDDSMAMGAVAALRDSGLRVPDDVAVAGFGDIAALRDVVPGLTTVRLPLAQMGRTALQLAFDSRDEAQLRHVTGTVVLRDSTPAR
ncbi:LacI family DNA-binding transcriptional regulator [Nakamurella deserti]|uniref:LacI family DNA-binding transcriptional regulator n=1 Tax=Nakamurella deserti TaxID=2164074 RepID=UPI000DBE8B9B|nr:LacI family DNA-binding transcriptional regulator [Nakamurella deserti]